MRFFSKKLLWSLIAVLGSSVITLSQAKAFSLGDHKRMTLQAVKEFNRCYPGTIGYLASLQFWTSNLDEDLNIFRKDLMFSHFYNPDKKLNMWRYDSSDRIKGLMLTMKLDGAMYGDNSRDIFADLGHLTHHLQDMASPPHVVPLMHGLNDGFENHADFEGDISSGFSCDEIKAEGANTDYLKVLDETGRETLKRVSETQVPVQIKAGNKIYSPKASVAAFWQEGEGNSFGRYGVFGNHFGDTQFVQDGVHYEIPKAFYEDYRQAQLKLGVQSTLRALSIYFLNR